MTIPLENVYISPGKRQDALVHILRGGKSMAPAPAEDLAQIIRDFPAVAALATGGGKAAIEALHRAEAGFVAAREALKREQAELEARSAKLRKAEAAAAKFAEALT